MPVIVVEEATDLPGLTDRLLRANTSAATREAAARALRDANPGVDLDALRPGTVVVVPELHGGLRRIGDVVGAGFDAATERVDTELAGLAAAFDSAEERAAAAREQAQAALADPGVKRALRGNEIRREVAARLKERVAEDEEQAARRRELADAVTAAWTEDLADLRRLWSAEG